MIRMKRYLFSMLILLTLALIAGVCVWFLYQDMNVAQLMRHEAEEKGFPEQSLMESSESVSLESDVTAAEPINITAESLSDNQRAILKSFGYGTAGFTITEAVIVCAQAEVGDERFREIVDGAAPSPMEALSLLPCMKAQ